MAEPAKDAQAGPGFVVLREVGDGQWQLVGELARRPGRPATVSRTPAPGRAPVRSPSRLALTRYSLAAGRAGRHCGGAETPAVARGYFRLLTGSAGTRPTPCRFPGLVQPCRESRMRAAAAYMRTEHAGVNS